MPWIQNISLSDVKKGHHIGVGENAMLIQIVDPDMEHPEPAYTFKEVHQFKFLDIEEDGMTNFGDGEMVDVSELAIKDRDAEALVGLLQKALDNKTDVVVHCVAGVCRSGAVAEVGVMMGFDDAEAFRSPNLLVKHKMLRALGWYYNEDEVHTVNGNKLDEDWSNDNEKIFLLAAARKKHRECNNKE